MSKTLGLDLGTNSIGWAIIDTIDQKILGMGSRIFPMGIENIGEGDNELSKNASRTGSRGTRRQFFRKRLSKKKLLIALAKLSMCPLSNDDIAKWNETKQFPEIELKEWFSLNPYELRYQALHQEISLFELGRVLYHMMQRRGFLSNSRKAGNDDGAIYKGKAKEGKVGITETKEKIQVGTLGSYLYEIYPKSNEPFKYNNKRIRNRYTTRSMYMEEFDMIWEKQSLFHKELSPETRIILGGRKHDGDIDDGILFFQRPLRSQKHLIGNCSLEPSKTKCPLSAIPFEKFRIYQWVNTVECNGIKIGKEERNLIADFLLITEKPAFKRLRKLIGKESAEFKFNYKDDDKIVGSHTISKLTNKKFFGKQWFNFTEKEQEDIWHALYFFESKSKLRTYAMNKWGFNEKQAAEIANFNLKDGYSNLSRKAINNILPFLMKGFTYDISVVLGGIKNVLGKEWSNLTFEQKSVIYNHVPDIIRSRVEGGFINEIKDLLIQEFQVEKEKLNKLYHHSAEINHKEVLDKLPLGKEADRKIQAIRNPIVITALFELRKLINALIDKYGSFDEIKVEMARDLKQSKIQRNQVRREQKRLEKENDRIKSEVENYVRATHESILKYKLWEECKKTCPYTGKSISISELFTGKWQIEHIHPWSRSLNDSFMNKTLCDADENRRKGDKTPYELYSDDENNWSIIKERALKIFSDTKEYPKAYQKFKRFVQQKFDDDFSSRQLNDTRYISKEAKNYLSQICKKVTVSPGQVTANLRHKWGLNSLLNDENEKTREDHRHHAIDALVMACTKQSFVQELSLWNRYHRGFEAKAFSMPWDTFHTDAESIVNQILVSHKRENKTITTRSHHTIKEGVKHKNLGVAARGQLHKETVFGKRQAPNSEEAFHIRKSIDSLTTEKQINKVVDPVIRKLIKERISELGGYVKDKVPPNTFFISDENGHQVPQIFLPNKNGEPVPIIKVRLKENIGGAEKLKDNLNQWVNPRKNHHVLIYIDDKDQIKEDVVTFWTVVERKRNGLPIYQLPIDGKEIITTLQINDLFILGLQEEEIDFANLHNSRIKSHLYRVQKLSSKFYEFRLISESSLKNNEAPYCKRIRSLGEGNSGWLTFNPIKVHLNNIGHLYKI